MTDYTYPRISEEEYRKARFQFQGAVSVALLPLRMYGQSEYVDSVIPEIVKLAEQFGMRVRGKDQPITLNVKFRPDD